MAGVSQPLEWAEFPIGVDAFVIIGLAARCVQFLPPFFSRGLESLYVSSWYIIGGLVFTLLAYPMGNIVPEIVPGAQGAAFSGLWIHDAVGLFVTPMAVAILYFVIPAAIRAADLQPLPVDARVLAPVLRVPAQRHASLRVFGHSDGSADHGDRRVGHPRRHRDPGRVQPADVAARRPASSRGMRV